MCHRSSTESIYVSELGSGNPVDGTPDVSHNCRCREHTAHTLRFIGWRIRLLRVHIEVAVEWNDKLTQICIWDVGDGFINIFLYARSLKD